MAPKKLPPGVKAAHRKEYSLRYTKEHSEERKISIREFRYGAGSHEHFLKQLERQGNRCAICEREVVQGRSTHLDHDHATGQWRGALCISCNNRVGILENALWIEKVTRYLDAWKVS